MTTANDSTTDFTLSLTEEERTHLLTWLEQSLSKKLVEEHRTDASDYRAFVVHQEGIIEQLIQKLQRV